VVRVAKPRDLGDVQDVQVYMSFVYDGGFLGRYGWVSGAGSFARLYLFSFFSSRLLVRAYTWVYVPAFPFLLPLYALHPYPSSLFPSSI
jgi:hypothetical protein